MLRLSPDLRDQILRYGVSGAGLTAFYSAVYWIFAVPIAIAPLLANLIAFLATVVAGWLIHSRWSFRGHGSRDKPMRQGAIFLAVNIGGFLLNSLWVWLLVEYYGLAPSWPILPIMFVTPWLSFYFNRRWTFS
ncbi:MAG: GtrA family protein [Sphingomonadaceae bacterium]|nr:GtrA family protein [Sphingomonadaceae bacterium]